MAGQKCFVTLGIVGLQNTMPQGVIEARNLGSFKEGLGIYMNNIISRVTSANINTKKLYCILCFRTWKNLYLLDSGMRTNGTNYVNLSMCLLRDS